MNTKNSVFVRATLSAILLVFVGPMTAFAAGLWLSSSGPVNRSMGGASVAAPIDAVGALFWNPGTISGLPNNEMAFGMEMLLADIEVSSTFLGVSGKTSAEPGVVPLPSFGWVHHIDGTDVTIGLFTGAVAGFRTNYPADPTNPILNPNGPPMGLGIGRVFTEAEFSMIAPIVSVALTDRLSIGMGPTLSLGRMAIDPFIFAPPNAAPPNGFASGRASRQHFGGGAQAGIYYTNNRGLSFGAAIKSPQWFETFRFHSEDAAGNPRVVSIKVDLPMIVSIGMAYSTCDDTVFALDVRYFDYKSTDFWGTPGFFNADGSLTGLDWSDTFSVALGIQKRLSDITIIRFGYSYNPSPIRASEMAYNFPAPLIQEHIINTGVSINLAESVSMNLAYSYVVENEKNGPILTPGTNLPIPGSSVGVELAVHILSMGISVVY
ncbi:MAG: outer membrane protein transport protein [Planctomycetes bacterium]|nr:outer membrane protein transport protein [Planctomycetota bacterium]